MIAPFARARRALFRAGVLRRERLPRPVISVGNLTVGGTGKTPHVLHLARWLGELGVRPAVLSRGYGRSGSGMVWVSDGEGRRASDAEAGDEPALMADSLPGVPVIVGASRFAAGMACLERGEVDVFLLDDGFQHLRLHRDVDVLLVDAGRRLGNGLTLPLGPLREPPSAAREADALVVTKAASEAEGAAVAAGIPFPEGRPRAVSRLAPVCLVWRSGEEAPIPPGGTAVAAFCGLARNGQFRETLARAGLDVRVFLPYGDHHRYTEADVARIARAAGGLMLLTTEKDLRRIPPGVSLRAAALRVGVEFLSGWEALSARILSGIGRRAA